MSFAIKQRIRERIATEEGAFHKQGSRLKVGLAYPNHYYFGMSNLGFQVLYHLINQDAASSCERLFLPEEDLLPQHGYGSLMGYEQETLAQDMAMVAFSISYQNDYLNLIPMLHLIGVEALSRNRQENDPLILVGGPAVTINPEPIAELCDAIVIGEGEEVIQDILSILKLFLLKKEL